MCGSFSPGRVQPAHLAREQPQALGAAVLLGVLEQQLHAQAEPEHGTPARARSRSSSSRPSSRDRAHPGGKGADAGQHQTVGGAQHLGVAAGV